MDWVADPQVWIAFGTLMALEIVLGIDNVIFISILAGKLPAHEQQKARLTGLGLAVFMRLLLLLSLSWIIGLTAPMMTIGSFALTGRDLILLAGGLFLIFKSTREIHQKLEGVEGHASSTVKPSFASVITQILLLDLVFSLDSVITAVGMVDEISIMVAAVLVSTLIMIVSARGISEFVNRHPTVKILALSFLLLIGFTLIVEGLHQHIPKGYIYFAMAFSVLVEMLNLRMKKKQKAAPVHLHESYTADGK